MPTLMKEKTKANGKMNAKTVHRKNIVTDYRPTARFNFHLQISAITLS